MDDKEKYRRLKQAISIRLRQLRETVETNYDADLVKMAKGGVITLEGIQDVINTMGD